MTFVPSHQSHELGLILTLLAGLGILWALVHLFMMGPRLEQVKGFSKRFGGPRRAQGRQADIADQKAGASSSAGTEAQANPIIFGSFIPGSMAPLRGRRKSSTPGTTTSSKPSKGSSSVQLPQKYTSNSTSGAYAEFGPADWNAGESSNNPIDLSVGSKFNPVDLTDNPADGSFPEPMPPAGPLPSCHLFQPTSQSIQDSFHYFPSLPLPPAPQESKNWDPSHLLQSHGSSGVTPGTQPASNPFLFSSDTSFSIPNQGTHLSEALAQLKTDEAMARMLAEEEEEYDWGPMHLDGSAGLLDTYLTANVPELGLNAKTYGEASSVEYVRQSVEMEVDPPGSSASPIIELSNEDEESEADIPEGERILLDQLKQYVGLLSVPCAGCSRRITVRQEDIPIMTRRWAGSTGKIVCGLQCSGSSFCTVTTCPGCQNAIKAETPSGSGFGSTSGRSSAQSLQIRVGGIAFSVYYCCDGGREFALWALSCGWDPVPTKSLRQTVVSKLRTKQQAAQSAQSSMQKHASAHLSLSRDRISRNKAPVTTKGTGYGGTEHHLPFHGIIRRGHRPPQFIITPKAPDAKEDLAHEAYFRLVAKMLPSLDVSEPGNLDMNPPIHLSTMLARSPLMVRAADMLSNDSLDDISRQHSLYDGMLDFISALSNHTATAGLVYNNRQVFAKSGRTLSVSFMKADKQIKKVTPTDTSRPLTDLLSRLAVQGKTMLQHAKNNQSEFAGRTEANMVHLAGRVVEISGLHQINLQRFKGDMMEIDGGKGKKTASLSWTEFHREHAVQELDDARVLHNHYFMKTATEAAAAMPPRGRMKRLITEISTLQTSLPEGIFVRHGSSRLDVMKIMIVGPKGTPYEYGFFEFDLFCPIDYPTSPPKVHFKTTGGGKIRFNPNLYEDGKVCLSLLGTWSGEPWRPEHSTLLQVLVSIQSMILCEEPWYNEPGRETSQSQSQSTRYNNEVRAWTLQYAIYPWVSAIHAFTAHPEQTQQTSSAWRVIAQTHLRLFARDIENTSTAASKKSRQVLLEESAKNIRAALEKQGYLV